MRYFNINGPCNPAHHYMLPALSRLPKIERMLQQRAWFVIYAPGPTGKTTAAMELARALTDSGSYVSAVLPMKDGAPFSHDIGGSEKAILKAWRVAVESQLPPALRPPVWPDRGVLLISDALHDWAAASPAPLALFLDDVDALEDDAMSALLHQLRASFPDRPEHHPSSVALISQGRVRDYRANVDGKNRSHPVTFFNIVATSFKLDYFTIDEVGALYRQHTGETGQAFSDEALQRVFDLTRGQPWLVNALAKVAVEDFAPDRSVTVTSQIVDRAKERLFERMDSHLDTLAKRLRDPRVQSIIETILTAGSGVILLQPDDIHFITELGLVRLPRQGGMEIANPIYREMIRSILAL